jgi:hypothetical protein
LLFHFPPRHHVWGLLIGAGIHLHVCGLNPCLPIHPGVRRPTMPTVSHRLPPTVQVFWRHTSAPGGASTISCQPTTFCRASR